MRCGRGRRFAFALLLVAGCATRPPAVVQPAPLPEAQSAAELEQIYRQRAAASKADRRWADAAIRYELLVILRPDSSEYRAGLDEARRRNSETAEANVRAAEQARRRGENDQAMTLYLRALGADPGNATAAAGLKAIEAERARRAWLNRPPRIPYARPGQAPQPYDPTKDDVGPRR